MEKSQDKEAEFNDRINAQEVIRRNIEALCTVWKTFKVNEQEGHTACDEIWMEVLEKIREHVKALTTK
jgi:hypothetical protein